MRPLRLARHISSGWPCYRAQPLGPETDSRCPKRNLSNRDDVLYRLTGLQASGRGKSTNPDNLVSTYNNRPEFTFLTRDVLLLEQLLYLFRGLGMRRPKTVAGAPIHNSQLYCSRPRTPFLAGAYDVPAYGKGA